MKTARRLLPILVLLAIVSSACPKAPPSLSPVGKTDFYKTQVVHQLDLLRDTAIAANALPNPLLSTDDTREVVAVHRSLLLTLQASTDGWVPAVKLGLDQINQKLKPPQQVVAAPYIAAIKLILDEVTQ